jgi:hypothetical protein
VVIAVLQEHLRYAIGKYNMVTMSCLLRSLQLLVAVSTCDSDFTGLCILLRAVAV